MNPMLPPHGKVLRVTYFDSIIDPTCTNPILAYIYKSGTHFIADCNIEDIRIDLQTLADTAPYSQYDNDLTALRSMEQHLTNGVNKYSRKDYGIIDTPQAPTSH